LRQPKNLAALKSIICLVIALCLVDASLAVSKSFETVAVARIVGDEPEELRKQLEVSSMDLKKASYFPHDQHFDHTEDKVKVLEENFPDHYILEPWDLLLQIPIPSWNWTDIDKDVNSWNKDIFLAIEARGNVEDNTIQSESLEAYEWIIRYGLLDFLVQSGGAGTGLHDLNFYSDPIDPSYLENWKNEFATNDVLFVFDSDYAGLYLPNQDSFIKRIGQDAIVVSPLSYASREFVRAFICNLGKYPQIGEVFRQARNNYYWGVDVNEELIGLGMLSYALYGNPTAKVTIPYYNENEIEEYCENYLDYYPSQSELAMTSQGFSAQGELTNVYSRLTTLQIDSYDVEDIGNHSILTTDKTVQNYILDELVLPITTHVHELPLKSVVLNISVISFEDPVDVTIPNLPGWEDAFVNRTCFIDSQPAGISYSHSFTEDSEMILVSVNPVEVINCTEGRLRLYKTTQYKIEYLPNSPVLIEYVHYPDELLPEQHGTIYVTLRNIKTEPAIGNLVLKEGSKVVAEKDASMTQETQMFNIGFTAPAEEGLRTYTVGFEQDSEIKTETSFRINIDLLSADLLIPRRVGTSTTVLLRLYNKLSEPLNIQINHYLENGDNVLDSGSLSRTLTPGFNIIDLTYSNLKKEDQSYNVLVDLLYANRKEVLSGSIVTNHPPILNYIPDIIVNEGEPVIINTDATDFDYDYLTYSISGPVGDDGIWYTDYDSAGTYTVTVTVNDGYLTDSQEVLIKVNDINNSRKVVFRDCNYGVYRGGFAEIALDSDFDGSLESWYSNSQFEELGQHFGFRTNEDWPLGTCLHASDLICVEDSDSSDPDWYNSGDSYPDPKFEQGGTCDTDTIPNPLYKDHEVCEGNIGCDYPICTADSDCGINEWVGDYYCINNTVYHNYRNHSCIYAGTYNSDCVYSDVPLLMENCTASQECYDGQCIDIACYAEQDCGNDGYLGAYCTETGIYNDYRDWTCNAPGTSFASCTHVDTTEYITSCNTDQICVYGECVDKNFYILGTFEDGSTEKEIKYLVAGNETVYIHLPKHSEIRNATVNVMGGVE